MKQFVAKRNMDAVDEPGMSSWYLRVLMTGYPVSEGPFLEYQACVMGQLRPGMESILHYPLCIFLCNRIKPVVRPKLYHIKWVAPTSNYSLVKRNNGPHGHSSVCYSAIVYHATHKGFDALRP